MSKITISLNSIINTLCEDRFDTLENRIRSACTKLFDFDYIEDKEAREIFELLFCTTYIARSIYTPSVSLFRLRLKSELQALAPVFNHNWAILTADISELEDVTVTESEASNDSNSSGSGSSKGMNIDSRYPQRVIDAKDILSVNHAEYGSRNESSSEQSSSNNSTAKGKTTTTGRGKLDLMLKYKQLQRDLIGDLVRDLEKLFILVY